MSSGAERYVVAMAWRSWTQLTRLQISLTCMERDRCRRYVSEDGCLLTFSCRCTVLLASGFRTGTGRSPDRRQWPDEDRLRTADYQCGRPDPRDRKDGRSLLAKYTPTPLVRTFCSPPPGSLPTFRGSATSWRRSNYIRMTVPSTPLASNTRALRSTRVVCFEDLPPPFTTYWS